MALFLQNKLPLGLDISDYKLRLIQIKRKSKKNKIISFSEIEVPAGIINNGLICDEKKVIALLLKLKKQTTGSRLLTNKVIISLPEKQSFIKIKKINRIIKKVILKDIDKNIPYDIDKIYFDYQIIEKYFDNAKGLHFAACKKEIIDQYLHLLKITGFAPEVLEIETESIARCLLPDNLKNKSFVIVDVGRARTTVFVIYKNVVIFSISFASVIKEKIYLSELISSLEKVIFFYQQELNISEPISSIITCGSGAAIKGLNEETMAKFKIQSFIGDPLQNIKNKNSFLLKKIKNPLGFTTAIGLALRGAIYKDYI